MLKRRNLLAGGLLGTVAGAIAPTADAVPLQRARSGEDDSVGLLREILDELRGAHTCRVATCPEVDRVRANQRVYFKANGKFPDFMDIGLDIWDRVYEWHVQSRQPIQVTRLADGRLCLAFMQTQLIVRADQPNDYVSLGFDAR